MTLDPNDARPPYQQIADELRRSIQRGEYVPGDQLPSISELAERYDVAKNTIQAAIRVLREAGLVVARHGKGVFVRTDVPPPDSAPDLGAVMRQLDALSAGMQQLSHRVADLEEKVRSHVRQQ